MVISWFVFLFFVSVFAYRGYRQGIWAASTRIVSLVLAYLIAILFTLKLMPIIEQNTVIQGVAALVTAGMLLFIGSSLILSLLFFLLGKLINSEKPSTTSAKLGALIGTAIGSIVGLAGVFFVSYLVNVIPKDRLPDTVQAQSLNGIERLAHNAAAKVINWAGGLSGLDDSTAKLSAALVREPGVVLEHVKNIQRSPDVKSLLNDSRSQAALRSGDVGSIQSLPSFQNLLSNPDVKSLMEISGLNEDGNGEVILAEQMSSVWQRAELLKNDQGIQNILRDPEFQRQLQNGNPMALLNNAEFMAIASKLLGDNEADLSSAQQASSSTNSSEEATEVKEPEIYYWVDDEGNKHYSDRQLSN